MVWVVKTGREEDHISGIYLLPSSPSFFVFILKMRVVLNLLPEVSWSVFSPLTIVIRGRALMQTIKGVMVLRF